MGKGGYLGGGSIVSSSGFFVSSGAAVAGRDREVATPHEEIKSEPWKHPGQKDMVPPSAKGPRPARQRVVVPASEDQLPGIRNTHLAVVLNHVFIVNRHLEPVDARGKIAIEAEIEASGGIYRWAAAQPGILGRVRTRLGTFVVSDAMQDFSQLPGASFKNDEHLLALAQGGGRGWAAEHCERIRAEIELLAEEKSVYPISPALTTFSQRRENKAQLAELNAEAAQKRALLNELVRFGKVMELFEALALQAPEITEDSKADAAPSP